MKNLVENYVNELLEEWEAEDQALEEQYYSDLDNLTEELENLLLEGNMPRDLIAAYRRSNGKENASTISNLDPEERHDELSYKQRIPYAYDYGKAEYEPLTKERLFEVGLNGIRLYKLKGSEDIHLQFIWIDKDNPPEDYWGH